MIGFGGNTLGAVCRMDWRQGERRQDNGVRSLWSPSERRWKREFRSWQLEYIERGKCVICDRGKVEVMVKGIPRRL